MTHKVGEKERRSIGNLNPGAFHANLEQKLVDSKKILVISYRTKAGA